MQADILQSTQPVIVIKVYLSDHVTPATGKTVAITISVNKGAFANPSGGATNATEIGNGWYYYTPSTTDTGTIGPLIVLGTCSGCDNADQAYYVTKATNRGMTAIPDTVLSTNASLLTSGTGTDQLSVSAGKVLLQATQSGVTIPTVTTVGSVSGAVGSVTGAVGSVAGAVGSVTGNVGGNVVGSTASVTGAVGSVTGAVGSVTGNVGGNVTGSVGSISGITFPTHFSLLAIDGSGDVTFNNTSIATAATVTNPVTLTLTQALSAARALDSVADTSLTVNDALQCAVASVSAQVDASSGTTIVFKTASTGTTLRTKTLTLITPPATVPDKAV